VKTKKAKTDKMTLFIRNQASGLDPPAATPRAARRKKVQKTFSDFTWILYSMNRIANSDWSAPPPKPASHTSF